MERLDCAYHVARHLTQAKADDTFAELLAATSATGTPSTASASGTDEGTSPSVGGISEVPCPDGVYNEFYNIVLSDQSVQTADSFPPGADLAAAGPGDYEVSLQHAIACMIDQLRQNVRGAVEECDQLLAQALPSCGGALVCLDTPLGQEFDLTGALHQHDCLRDWTQLCLSGNMCGIRGLSFELDHLLGLPHGAHFDFLCGIGLDGYDHMQFSSERDALTFFRRAWPEVAELFGQDLGSDPEPASPGLEDRYTPKKKKRGKVPRLPAISE